MMMNRKPASKTKLLLVVGILGVLMLGAPNFAAVNAQHNESSALEEVFQRAQEMASYEYRADVLQGVYPAPTVTNVGRAPQTTHFSVYGQIEALEERLNLTLQAGNQAPISITIEDGLDYGRVEGSDEWTSFDQVDNFFSPGGDPLAYLSALQAVRQIKAADAVYLDAGQLPPEMRAAYTLYAFEIDSLKFADYMRREMEEELRRRGELPAGFDLEMAEAYFDMVAEGEIWVDEQGLPVRQVIHMTFPPQAAGQDRIEAQLTAQFGAWAEPMPGPLTQILNHPDNMVAITSTFASKLVSENGRALHQTILTSGLVLIAFSVLALLFVYRRSPRLYALIISAIVITILVNPILSVHQAEAAFGRNEDRLVAQAEAQTATTAETELTSSTYNPLDNPLSAETTTDYSTSSNNPLLLQPQFAPQVAAGQTVIDDNCAILIEGDIDCDGDIDDDDDGLTDRIEVEKLGTDWEDVDTDGDGISDKREALGFTSGGQIWYLNPLDLDSNRDGLADSLECPELLDIEETGVIGTPIGTACGDLDGNGAPDVFDYDNDGDGVPDYVDSAPSYNGSLSTDFHTVLELDLDTLNSTPNDQHTVLAQFEIRPTEYDHLFQTNNVLDWPTNDVRGQYTRVYTNTFADEGFVGERMDNGDMLLVPMLELVIPAPSVNNANPSGGLPVIADYDPAAITDSNLADWLDTDYLDQYKIEVNQSQTTGELIAYIPLSQIVDPIGKTPVAWGAQMPYRPVTSNFGRDHSYKLIWMIQALVDECDLPSDAEYDEWCAADSGNWQTGITIVHSYYEDFYVTGLTVTEEYGYDLAVIAQNDALNQPYEDDLWSLGNNLLSTFVDGDLNATGDRYGLDDVPRWSCRAC
jgi:hypothetical protein